MTESKVNNNNKTEEESFIPPDPEKEKLDAFFGGDLQENPGDDLLTKMENFVETHVDKLYKFNDNFTRREIDTWNSYDDFISLDVTPYENVNNPVFLIEDRTDNPVFNKITTVFSALCQEMIQLKQIAINKYYNPLTMFGVVKLNESIMSSSNESNESNESDDEKQDTIEAQIGRFLPFLQQLSNFVSRINVVVKNTVEQLAYLYHPKQKLYISTYKDVSMDYILEKLGETLTILVTLDIIIRENRELSTAWERYKKMIGYVRGIPEKMGFDPDELNDFQHQIVSLENTIMNGEMFLHCINQKYGVFSKVQPHLQKEYEEITKKNQAKEEQSKLAKSIISQMQVVSVNRALYEELDRYLKGKLKFIQNHLLKKKEVYHRSTIVDFYSLYALYNKLFSYSADQDFKLYQQAWKIQLSLPLVYLTGKAVWYLSDFMLRYIPLKLLAKNKKSNEKKKNKLEPKLINGDIKNSRILYLKRLDLTFNNDVQELYMLMCDWLIKWDTESNTKIRDIKSTLRTETRLLMDGLVLATKIHNLLTTTLMLHLNLGINFKKSNLRSLSVCAELLKSIEDAFHRRSRRLSSDVSYMLTVISFSLIRIFEPLRQMLDADPRPSNNKLDCLAGLSLCISLLSSAPTLSRLVVINVAACVATHTKLMKVKNRDEVKYNLWKLKLVSSWEEYLHSVTNCAFFYYASDFIPIILSDIFDNPDQAHRLPIVFAYLNDPVSMLKSTNAEKDKNRIFKVYSDDVHNFLRNSVITELCKCVENDLRLQVMDMLEQRHKNNRIKLSNTNKNSSINSANKGGITSESTAPKKYSPRKDYGKFIQLKPFRVLDTLIDIKKFVENYINETFYNMNTLALHQWDVYAEMRNLGKQKYNLNLIETHLPSQSHFSEGLDVLEIMRNLHLFVLRYNYNLNSQIFIERAFDQLHLNTINVYHVANSIRTHGPGIMSTTVNFAYQYCINKFITFSEFLYDDHIKSRLIKDIRYFRDNKKKLNNRYPFELAKKFNNMIRSFGQDQKGKTFLDHFRILITRIGNALGYVRMIRSGGLLYTSQAIKYVPDIEAIPEFLENVTEAKLSDETQEAAKNLDEVLKSLSTSFSTGVDYFRMLVSEFKSVVKSADHGHLKNFVGIMPALTQNFVDSMLAKKERLNRKAGRQDEAAFTDDGFALGCAFILKILDLYSQFEAYHWWEEVLTYLNKQNIELQKKKNNKNNQNEYGENDLDTWQLSFKRTQQLTNEWNLLYYSFTASKIFFRFDNTKQDSEKKEDINDKKDKNNESKEDDNSNSDTSDDSEEDVEEDSSDETSSDNNSDSSDDKGETILGGTVENEFEEDETSSVPPSSYETD